MADKQGDLKAPGPARKRAQPKPKPTPRIAGNTTLLGVVPEHDAVLEAWQAAGVGADRSAAELARQISESGGLGNIRRLADQVASASSAPVSDAVREMVDRWSKQDQQLRAIQLAALDSSRHLRDIVPLPLPVRANAAMEEYTGELVTISARTSEQIGQVAGIAQTVLEQVAQGVVTATEMHAESKQLRETLAGFSKDAKRSGTWMIRLTVAVAVLTAALVLLTYVIAADALGWWPFTQ